MSALGGAVVFAHIGIGGVDVVAHHGALPHVAVGEIVDGGKLGFHADVLQNGAQQIAVGDGRGGHGHFFPMHPGFLDEVHDLHAVFLVAVIAGDDDGGVVIEPQVLQLLQVGAHDFHVARRRFLQGGVGVVGRLGAQVIGRVRALEKLDDEVFAVAADGAQALLEEIIVKGVAVFAGVHLAAGQRHRLIEGEAVRLHIPLEHVGKIPVGGEPQHHGGQPVVAHGVIAAGEHAQVVHVGLGVPDAEVIVGGIEEIEFVTRVGQRLIKALGGFTAPGLLEPGVNGHGVVKLGARQHVHHRGKGADVGRVAVVVIGKVAQRLQHVRKLLEGGVDVVVAVIIQQEHDHVAFCGHLILLVAGEHIGGIPGAVGVAGQVLKADHAKGEHLHGQQHGADGADHPAGALFEQCGGDEHRGQQADPQGQVAPAVGGVPGPIHLFAVQQPQIQVEKQVLHVAAQADAQNQRQSAGKMPLGQQRHQQAQHQGGAHRHTQQGNQGFKKGEAEVGGVAGENLHGAPQAVHKA